MAPKRKSLLAELELSKRKALSNLYFFDKYVLGYDKMVERVHRPLLSFVQNDIPHGQGEQTTKLILQPRGSFKSVCVTIGYSLWRLVNNPELTILITNEKLDKSKNFLKEIKGHIESNEIFKTLFGEWSCERVRGRKWSEVRIDIAPRKKVSAAPNIEVSSTESSEVGKHFDLIIGDDLVGASNVTTADQMEKVINYYRDLGSVLKPGGEMILIGTRWDYRDLYQFVLDIKKQMGDLARIEVVTEKAIRDDGSLWFPEELSEQFLATQRIKQGTYFFSCQYQNTPVDKDNALIMREDILKWRYKDDDTEKDSIDGVRLIAKEKLDEFLHYVTVDLAHTENKRSDSTAIVVNAVNPNSGRWFIRHTETFKTADPSNVINRIFQIHKQYRNIVTWGIEKNNYDNWLKKPIEYEMRKRDTWLNIEPLAHYRGEQAGQKALRLRGLGPRFKFRNCYIREDMINVEDQLLTLTYDGAKGHDDLLDALAMQEEVANWGNQEEANREDNELAVPKDSNKKDNAKRYAALMQEEDERGDLWMRL